MTENIEKLKEISKDRQQQKELMKKNGDNSHEMLSEGNYTDTQHFIYELLQNAEDETANKVQFELQNDKMIFSHDSKHLFELGDIIAISNFGDKDSPKRKRENAIGRYGIGFKSVLAITEEPRIQSGIFDVSLKERFVPIVNDEKFKSDKTKIILPLKSESLYPILAERFSKINGDEIIFLNNINELEIAICNNYTSYKKIKKDNLLIITKDDEVIGTYFLLSKQVNIEERNLTIKVVFGIQNNKIISLSKPLYVFFPTKDETNLSFAIHAPFKLATHTREHIDKEYPNNKELLKELAALFVDNLEMIRDKGYVDVDFFNNIFPFRTDKKANKIYALFYEKCLEKLRAGAELLPTNENNFSNIEKILFIGSSKLVELLSKEQLQALFSRTNWISDKITSNVNKDLFNYLRTLQIPDIDLKYFLNKLNIEFLTSQSDKWLTSFYKAFCEIKTNNEKEELTAIISESDLKKLPIIRTSKDGTERKMVLPENAFLPPNISNSFQVVTNELLNDNVVTQFLSKLGIKKPQTKDKIRKIIREEENLGKYFEIIFDYWKDEKPQQIIDDIKSSGKPFLKIKGNNSYGKASEMYLPTKDLVAYFETKPDTKFVDLEDYHTFITDEKERQILKEFLLKLGVSVLPRIFRKETEDCSNHTIIKENNLDRDIRIYNRRGRFTTKINDYFIDGFDDIFGTQYFKEETSFLLWNNIIISYRKYYHAIFEYAVSTYETKKREFSSNFIKKLISSKWLLSTNNEFVAPNEITIDELANGYERNAELERLLEFKQAVILTETERIAQKFESEEEAEEARKALEEKREKEKRKEERKTLGANTEVDTDDLESAIESLENLSESVSKPKTEKEKTNTLPDFDEDEELAEAMDIAKQKIELKKERQSLANSLNESKKYSYEWFKAYLQLLTTYGEKQDTQKQKSISFQEIRPYKTDNKYFLLCGASSYISPEIENANDFKITLVFGGGKKENINVEGVSKKGQDLLIYCHEPLSSNTLSRLSNIFKVEINFTPVIDLLDRLYKVFTNSNYIDEWQDIQEAIPSLHFIYGPPGTGKTTTLCNNINEILAKNPNTKFLVLTPTNKAADVVCKKLQDINPDIYAIRLSRPTDPELEESGIYVDSLDNKSIHNINVVTSTIHRLPYFEINGEKDGEVFEYKLFKHRNFDYVIFDESSMTGLHYITFAIMALFKTNPNTNFIIAGDPKQISPVIEIEEKELENFDFQDENIYKMMNLESFNPNEQTIRENDTIQNLDTQYRSILQIGQLFSELSYSSLLKHDRTINRKETKPLPEKLRSLISSNVTFIDIPLNEDNSIYKVNKLFYSSYHTYCAILVAEIIKYFDTVNKNAQWTIGLIAPYKAQAILLNKLITSYGISENVKVYSDTVHGFQGDECDMVFFVCNPNNYFYSGHEKALLSKEYIYNVAISRAKDYLIVLHPYTAIQNNKFINKIGFSYKSNFGNAKILNAKDIEKILFKDQTYIEKNSYVSGHDNVNVFGLSEMKYFIKANDTAIDIQLNNLEKISK